MYQFHDFTVAPERKFQGRWITDDEFYQRSPVNVFHRQLDAAARERIKPEHRNRHLLFRRRFTVDDPAGYELFITADDYYKLYVNGILAGQGPAAGYSFHYFYNRIDLSPFLRPGENTLAIHTYYQGLINRVWVSGDDQHGLLLDLVRHGKTLLGSDETFRVRRHTGFSAAGTAGYDTQFLERYDAAAPEVGFEQPDFDDSQWAFARPRSTADYHLFPQPTPMLVRETIAPAAIRRHDRQYSIDFGAMYVGSLTLRATGAPGMEIVMRFGQELNPDGTVRYQLRANCEYVEYFRLSGQAGDMLNQFDYKSFRYVELQLPEGCKVDEASVRLIARHAPFELKATCNWSNEQAEKVWQLCVRTLHYGVQEVIQDCMEREKGYYLGDGCYSMLTYCLLTRNFIPMEKFFDDFLRTAFINRGLMTCGCCSLMQEIAEYPLMMFTMLLEYGELTGNWKFIDERYAAFADILDFYREQYAAANGLLNNLDKWCVVEWPKNMRDGYDADINEGKVCTVMHNAVNAWYIGAIKCLNKIAASLGRPAYADVTPLEQAFIAAFYDPERKLFRDRVASAHCSLPGNVFAWLFELFPDADGPRNTIAMVREKRLSQSLFFVTFPLFCALARDGETALLHELLIDPHAWLNMLDEGGTTTFEGWGKETKWNTSLFHLTLSYGAAFLTDWDIAGIFTFPRS